MPLLTLIAFSMFAGLVICAALSDLTTMTIPNWISGLLILAFFPAAWLAGLGPLAVATHVGVGLAALVVGAAMFALRWLGGGDAKLLAAACLWMGLAGTPAFLIWTALAGGIFSLALLAARPRLHLHAAGAPAWLGRLLEPKGDIPYGVAIAIGALAAFPASGVMTVFVGAG